MGLIPKLVAAMEVLSKQKPHDSAVGQQHSYMSSAGLELHAAQQRPRPVAPSLGLGAPLKVSHCLKDFPMEVPFAK